MDHCASRIGQLFSMGKSASYPGFAVPGIEDEYSIRILGRQLRKQLVGFQISPEVIEVFHVREDIELFVALKQVVATGEVGEQTPREATFIPVHSPQPVAEK